MKRIQAEEFRRDLVSGEWILVSSNRQKRPVFFNVKEKKKTGKVFSKKECPFENPQKSGNADPVFWMPKPGIDKRKAIFERDWFTQIIPNKYPLLRRNSHKPQIKKYGVYELVDSLGFHEIVIARDHDTMLEDMTIDELFLVFKTYKERYRILEKDKSIDYILIFHNQGELAGASVPHPHSQIIALPIVPPDVSRSINGGVNFYEKYKKCAHCTMLDYEKKKKIRIINKNKYFISVAPFASRVPFEVRVYPIKHNSDFEETSDYELSYLAEIFKDILIRMRKLLNSQDYNFFIHTSSARVDSVPYYHWHIEILPRTYKWGGVELGIGVEVVSVPPELAAYQLRKAKK